jgi:hypothetical protein
MLEFKQTLDNFLGMDEYVAFVSKGVMEHEQVALSVCHQTYICYCEFAETPNVFSRTYNTPSILVY